MTSQNKYRFPGSDLPSHVQKTCDFCGAVIVAFIVGLLIVAGVVQV